MFFYRWCQVLIFFGIFLSSSYGQSCAGFPKFAEALGFSPEHSALSSIDGKVTGIQLIEIAPLGSTSEDPYKTFIHPSWSEAGFLGPITRDEYGNSYVSPLPSVSSLYNKPNDRNTIFKIDTESGEMLPWINLPLNEDISSENCFGILGMHYDCFTNKLLVSTVAGSTRNKENGIIYSIDIQTKDVQIIMTNADVVGLAVLRWKEQIFLCLGSARESYVYSIKLDKNLMPIAKPQLFLSLEGVGPRGDDKARKIKIKNESLIVSGTPFYYNLTAPVKNPKSQYTYKVNSNGTWQLAAIN